jgi:hypothetical protein
VNDCTSNRLPFDVNHKDMTDSTRLATIGY